MRSPAGGRRPWLSRILFGVLLLVIVLTAAGAVYEQVAEVVIAKKNPPRGTLYDVGGRRLHLYCAGQGPVTVVFDSGLGGYGNDWGDVQPKLTEFVRACSFDRAGFGWSDPGPLPRDSRSETADLHSLLTKAGERGPFVLVGHSLGGLNAQLYTLEFPDEVAGLVLVDSAHPEQWERLPPSPYDQGVVAQVTLMRRLVPFGISRLLGACQDDNDLPLSFCGRRLDTVRAEFVSVIASAHEVRDAFGASLHSAKGTAPPFGAKPLIVLSRDPSWGRQDPESLKLAWQVLQAELATLSSNCRRTIATGSGHYIHLSQPKLVIDAIRDVVSSVRSGALVKSALKRSASLHPPAA
jgi:pimeloyl-ACP methyl ester carboxylesterase